MGGVCVCLFSKVSRTEVVLCRHAHSGVAVCMGIQRCVGLLDVPFRPNTSKQFMTLQSCCGL